MPHVLIIESNPAERSAGLRRMAGTDYGTLYGEALKACRGDLTTAVCAPYDGEALPDLAGFDGVAFTGSGVDWSTEDARADPLAAAMRAAFAAGLPTVGSCNGMQLAASVLGGQCGASPNGVEQGLARQITLTAAGKAHPMMEGRRDGYAACCIHRDEVTRLPDGAVLLASNAHSPVQAFAYERDGVDFWGVQYHPEMSLAFIAALLSGIGRLSNAEAAAVRAADRDAEAAARQGARRADLAPGMLRLELLNWIRRL
jgi:GMP synthase (glutamine-hydrolysing)